MYPYSLLEVFELARFGVDDFCVGQVLQAVQKSAELAYRLQGRVVREIGKRTAAGFTGIDADLSAGEDILYHLYHLLSR